MKTNRMNRWKHVWMQLHWVYAASQGVRRRLLISCLAGLGEVMCSLGFVWASKRLIDIVTNQEEGSLWVMAVGSVLLIAMQLALAALDTWIGGCLSTDVSNRLRKRLFSHLLCSRWKDLEHYHSGDVLNRVNRDVDEVAGFITATLPDVFVTGVQFVASFAFLCSLDSSLALVLLVLIPLFLLLSRLYMRRMHRLNRNIRQSHSNIQAFIQESVQHHLVIKTLEHSSHRLSLLDGLQVSLRSQVKKRTRLSVVSRFLVSAGFNTGYLVVFLWGVVRLSRGCISFGTMSAFMQLVGRVQRPAFDLASFLPSFIASYTAVERLMELENIAKEEEGEPILFEEINGLRFCNVSFGYAANEPSVFQHWDAVFEAGTATAVLGTTGAGKTTLIRLALALVSPLQGRVVLATSRGEVPVSPQTRINFVYVPQGNTLFSGTIRENLLLGNEGATDVQLEEALRMAAAEFVFQLPDGMDTRLTEAGGRLSEGQAQRIAIARALLRKGNVLLFDEATSALDAETEKRLLVNLKTFCQGKTVLFITHHESLAALCDATIRLTS